MSHAAPFDVLSVLWTPPSVAPGQFADVPFKDDPNLAVVAQRGGSIIVNDDKQCVVTDGIYNVSLQVYFADDDYGDATELFTGIFAVDAINAGLWGSPKGTGVNDTSALAEGTVVDHYLRHDASVARGMYVLARVLRIA